MSFLSEEELASLAPAESTLFRSPIPVQSVSSDEFMPAPQSAKQREFEARVKRLLDRLTAVADRGAAPAGNTGGDAQDLRLRAAGCRRRRGTGQ